MDAIPFDEGRVEVELRSVRVVPVVRVLRAMRLVVLVVVVAVVAVVVAVVGSVTVRNLRPGSDTTPGPGRICGPGDAVDTTEQVFDQGRDTPGAAPPVPRRGTRALRWR
jgi:hypothetical protein